jgi:hypothetical protein
MKKTMKRVGIVLVMAGMFYVGAYAQAQGKVFGRVDVLKGLLNLAGRCQKAGMVEEQKVVMEAFGKVARMGEMK